MLCDDYLVNATYDNGSMIEGLFLEGGSWNKETCCLQEAMLLELICPMPVILFRTAEGPKKKSKSMETKYF